jgi:D-glycero-D-manno-heptose 1,7-bisphosphate phosphatase
MQCPSLKKYMAEGMEQARAVFLDRDGVINRAVVRDGRPYPPANMVEFDFLPGVVEAVSLLREEGFRIIVVTNQPDVAKGIQTFEMVEAMHRHLREVLQVDQIKVCYHIDEDGCDCRKPRPGMLSSACDEWGVDASRSFMVGDRWRDIEAGQAAGCVTVFIKTEYDEKQPEKPDIVVGSLREAVEPILQYSF